ncbi:hypothetical protein PGT21_023020 [Puccinia graminis f. sp. tritici]|uniref:Uncharacterized protein n=1 Tax=Puccinia graminis f. sp. tritici TaxID=56615 RepID=A0A5B0MG87_PUCGR|nr:hypothetical protein PGT21_023020 [Puccinia graminis f. sp. tritici]
MMPRPAQMNLILAMAFTRLVSLAAGRLSPVPAMPKDTLSENLAAELAHEDYHESFASTVSDWTSNMLTSIVSKATSGFRSTSLEEKGMRDLLDEADSFSKAVEELRGWVMKSNASNSPNAKKFLTQSIQLLMGCYRDIFKQIQNQVNGSCSSDTSRTAPKATRDSEFRKVVRRDLERRVGTLSAIFVSDTIRIENFNPGIVLNWENILLRAVDFFYKH